MRQRSQTPRALPLYRHDDIPKSCCSSDSFPNQCVFGGGAFLVNGTQQCLQGKAKGGGGRYRCRTSAGSSSGNHRGSSSYRRLAPPSAHTCRLAVNSFATEQTLLSAKKKKSSCARADDDDDDALNLDHNPCCCRRFFFFFRFLFLHQNSKRTKRRRNKQKL